MKTSSAKAKGRRLCEEFKQLLLTHAPTLHPDDIVVTSSGDTGEDLKLSPAARGVYRFVIECKNQEYINIHKALKQAESHGKGRPHLYPLLVFRKNNTEAYVAMRADQFMELVQPLKINKEQLVRSGLEGQQALAGSGSDLTHS